MANDGNVVARCASKSTTVTDLLLNVGNNGTFGDRAEREDVSDSQVGVLAGVDELTSVHALVCDEGLGVELESVRIAEDNLCQRSSSSWVVDDLLHNTSDVAMAFSVIESSECRRRLVQSSIGREHGSSTFSLVAYDTTLAVF